MARRRASDGSRERPTSLSRIGLCGRHKLKTMLEIIERIIEDKIKAQRPPYHALYSELLRSGIDREKINKELRELKDSGKILVGHTLNDVWIKLQDKCL